MFSNQFFLRKDKKSRSKLVRGMTAESPISNIIEMKKRVSFQRESSFQQDKQFIGFSSERDREVEKKQKLM
jgi:hypothetical protein